MAGFLKLELTAKLKTPPKHRLKKFRPEFSTDISMVRATCSPLTSAMECDAFIISHDSDSERAAKKARTVGRSIVDSVHLSALISFYNTHFAKYSVGRAKVTQVIPGKGWKAVYDDYKHVYPGSPFAEETLKFRVREGLL